MLESSFNEKDKIPIYKEKSSHIHLLVPKNIMSEQIINREIIENKDNNKNELMNNSDDDEDEDDFDLNNLTEEEKMALLQQREIIMKLQEEAEARERINFKNRKYIKWKYKWIKYL